MSEICELEDVAAEERSSFLALRARVSGTNINPRTLLATDYLNHFNEIVMLLDLLADAPECFEDVRNWVPKSYTEHFQDSNFRDKALAIEAYAAVPAKFRLPFEATVTEISATVGIGLLVLTPLIASGETDAIRRNAERTSQRTKILIDRASAIIHGTADTLAQAEIDALLNRG